MLFFNPFIILRIFDWLTFAREGDERFAGHPPSLVECGEILVNATLYISLLIQLHSRRFFFFDHYGGNLMPEIVITMRNM